jgi:pimeloyl-ACP methyl ester carboxylesterase
LDNRNPLRQEAPQATPSLTPASAGSFNPQPDYVQHNVAEFQRTGFHGGLNYYRAAEPYFHLSGAFKGARITQPSFFIWGMADGLKDLYPLTTEHMRGGLPGLADVEGVGHWVQHEASAEVSKQLVKFLRTVTPA